METPPLEGQEYAAWCIATKERDAALRSVNELDKAARISLRKIRACQDQANKLGHWAEQEAYVSAARILAEEFNLR